MIPWTATITTVESYTFERSVKSSYSKTYHNVTVTQYKAFVEYIYDDTLYAGDFGYDEISGEKDGLIEIGMTEGQEVTIYLNPTSPETLHTLNTSESL
jgi:hypothetical protein